MVIIQLAGGLGNQMFQYALYLQLKSLGRTVKIDDVSGFAQDRQRTPALGAFGALYERASRKELEEMLDCSPLLCHKIRRKLCGRKKKAYFEADKIFKPEILEWDDIYLEGYWQTEKYFRTAEDQVRAALDPDRLLLHYAGGRSLEEWLSRIESTESVSVHIRRGDYLLPENQELFGGICTETYYRAAVERMRREHPGCVFYLFTNDKEWAGKWLKEWTASGGSADERPEDRAKRQPDGAKVRMKIVDTADMPDDGMDRAYAEFVLMSKCRHNILANSSFSWWASYLNKNPHKTVLAPDRWLNGWDCSDFYRADMQKIAAGDKGFGN